MKRKRNVSLSSEADDALSSVGNASDYVARLVRYRSALWRNALQTLRASGASVERISAMAKNPPSVKEDASPAGDAARILSEELRYGNQDLAKRIGG